MKLFRTLLIVACLAQAFIHTGQAQSPAQTDDAAKALKVPGFITTESVVSHGIMDNRGNLLLKGLDGYLIFPASFKLASTATLTPPPLAKTYSKTLETIAVHAHAATATIAASELYGGVLTNTGASGAIVLSLPAPVVGMHFRVYLTVAQDVDINAATSTQILVLTNATADAISSAGAIGNSIELVAISATAWVAFASSGTWTDVN